MCSQHPVLGLTNPNYRQGVLCHTLTLLGHPHSKALLQPAVLATVPGDLVDDAVPVAVARVGHVLLYAAAEEALRKRHGMGK